MIYLLLSILTASGLNILFKLFGRKNLDLFKVIMVNYIVCFLIGQWINPAPIIPQEVLHKPWFPYALVLGIVFTLGFNVIAYTVHYFGVTVATVMQKMSLLISVIFAILVFNESVNLLKIIGLILAFISIILITYKDEERLLTGDERRKKQYLYLPVLTFVMSGFIDACFLYVSKTGIVSPVDRHFITSLFGIAALAAVFYYIYLRLWGGETGMQYGELIAGLILGTVNYFSIYFILQLLQTGWDGSIIFPMNNIGILIFSAVAGIFLFRERMNKRNRFGLILALLALVILGILHK